MDGDNPVGVWRGNAARAGIPAGARVCTRPQAEQYDDGGAFFKGTKTYRFTYVGTTLTLLDDERAVGVWATDGNGGTTKPNGDVVYDLEVGAVEPTVQIRITPAITGVRIVEFERFGALKLSFVSGVASVEIGTDVARTFEIGRSDDINLSNRLRVRVSAVKL